MPPRPIPDDDSEQGSGVRPARSSSAYSFVAPRTPRVAPTPAPVSRMRSEQRHDGVVRVAEIVDRAIREVGLTNAEVGEALGISASKVALMRWPRNHFDPRCPDTAERVELRAVQLGDLLAIARQHRGLARRIHALVGEAIEESHDAEDGAA